MFKRVLASLCFIALASARAFAFPAPASPWVFFGGSSATLVSSVQDIVVTGSVKANRVIFNDGTSMTSATGGSGILATDTTTITGQLGVNKGAGNNARAFFISTGATNLIEVTGTSATFNLDAFFNAGISFGSSGGSSLYSTQDHIDIISNYGTASSGTLSVWGSSVLFNNAAIGAGATLSSTNTWSARQDFIVTGATYVVRFATVNAETGAGSYGVRITSRVTLGIGADPSENMSGALGNSYSLGITRPSNANIFLRGTGDGSGYTTLDNFVNGVPTGRIRSTVSSFFIDTQRTQSPLSLYANAIEMLRINDDPQIISLRPRVGISIATPKSHFQVASGSVTLSGGSSALIIYRATNTAIVSTATESDRAVILSTHTPDYGNRTRFMVVDSSGDYQFLPSTFSGSGGSGLVATDSPTITGAWDFNISSPIAINFSQTSVTDVVISTSGIGLRTPSPNGAFQIGVGESSVVDDSSQTISIYASGGSGAYFKGRNKDTDLEFIMGASSLGTAAFTGTMSDDIFQVRQANANRIILNTDDSITLSGNTAIGTTGAPISGINTDIYGVTRMLGTAGSATFIIQNGSQTLRGTGAALEILGGSLSVRGQPTTSGPVLSVSTGNQPIFTIYGTSVQTRVPIYINDKLISHQKINLVLPIYSAKLSSGANSTGALIDGGSDYWRLSYSSAIESTAFWQMPVPQNYSSSPVILDLTYIMSTANNGNVQWDVRFMRISETDQNTTSRYGVANSSIVVVPNVLGYANRVQIPITDNGGFNAGDIIRILLNRDPTTASNAAGTAHVVGSVLRE